MSKRIAHPEHTVSDTLRRLTLAIFFAFALVSIGLEQPWKYLGPAIEKVQHMFGK